MDQPTYNFRNIRKLLAAAFSDDELRQLCYDVPEFRGVYEEFSAGLGKDQMIQKLIAYCDRKVIMGKLLTVIAEEASEQYTKFARDLIVGETGTELVSPPLEMPDEVEQLKKLLVQKTRELYDLQNKAAQFGALYTPSYISMQIEDLEKQIAELHQRLDTEG